MKLTAQDLYDLKVIDKIIKEPNGEDSHIKISKSLKKEISPDVSLTIRVSNRLSSIAESNNAESSSLLKKWGFALRAIGILKSDS